MGHVDKASPGSGLGETDLEALSRIALEFALDRGTTR
jgi:hypothetical protein